MAGSMWIALYMPMQDCEGMCIPNGEELEALGVFGDPFSGWITCVRHGRSNGVYLPGINQFSPIEPIKWEDPYHCYQVIPADWAPE